MTPQPSFSSVLQKRFLASYAVALAILVTAASAAHLMMDHALNDERRAAEIVNMSGKQRMLSQRAYALAVEPYTKERVAFRREQLAITLNAFEAAHHELHAYMAANRMPDGISAELERVFSAPVTGLDTLTQDFIALGETAEDRALTDEELDRMAGHAFGLMFEQLDAAVSAFQADAEAGLAAMERTHLVQIGILLAVLLGEALFIFWPLLRRLVAALAAEEHGRTIAENALRMERVLNDTRQRFMEMVRKDFLAPLKAAQDRLEDVADADTDAAPAIAEEARRIIARTCGSVTDMLDLNLKLDREALRRQAPPLPRR